MQEKNKKKIFQKKKRNKSSLKKTHREIQSIHIQDEMFKKNLLFHTCKQYWTKKAPNKNHKKQIINHTTLCQWIKLKCTTHTGPFNPTYAQCTSHHQQCFTKLFLCKSSCDKHVVYIFKDSIHQNKEMGAVHYTRTCVKKKVNNKKGW